MAKEIMFRGKTIEELKELDTREFAKLVKSRTRRAILRQTADIDNFVAKCVHNSSKNKLIKTQTRELVVVPKMIGYKIGIYSGKIYAPTELTIEMLGHRLGEFCATRNKVKHGTAGIGATKSSMAKGTKK